VLYYLLLCREYRRMCLTAMASWRCTRRRGASPQPRHSSRLSTAHLWTPVAPLRYTVLYCTATVLYCPENNKMVLIVPVKGFYNLCNGRSTASPFLIQRLQPLEHAAEHKRPMGPVSASLKKNKKKLEVNRVVIRVMTSAGAMNSVNSTVLHATVHKQNYGI